MKEENRIKKFFEETKDVPYFEMDKAGREYIKSRGILKELSSSFPNDLYIIEHGKEVCSYDKSPVAGVRAFLGLHYVFNGCGYIEYNGTRTRVETGSLFVLIPGLDMLYYPDPKTPWAYYQVTLSGLLTETVTRELGFDQDHYIFNTNRSEKIERAFATLHQAAVDTSINSITTLARLYSLLSEIKDFCKPSRVMSNKERYVYEVFSYLKNNAPTATAETVARNCMVSPEYLTRICESVVGLSLKECITVYRLQVTRNFLRQTDIPIARISRFYGCSDPKYFYKVFKKYFGITPSEYRKEEQAVKETKYKESVEKNPFL